MALTKVEAAARAREAKAEKARLEARADTEQPSVERDLSAEVEAGYRQANGLPEPASYVYIGGLNAVVVVIDGTAYDFRHGDPVHLAKGDAGLDKHPDFKKVRS